MDQLTATTSILHGLVDIATTMAGVDITGMYDVLMALNDLGGASVTSFSEALTESEDAVRAAIDTFVGYAIDEAKIKNKEFGTVGQNAVNGITDGMKALGKEPGQAIVAIMTQALKAVKEYMLIKSPSKRAQKEIAQPTIDGMKPTKKNEREITEAYQGTWTVCSFRA